MSTPSLNAEQQRAVETSDGPLCIIAGPGTGKTKTLTARIVHLMRDGVSASNILALTFTNKAAREMRERVAAALPADAALPTIATFHGLCHQLLSDEGMDIVFVDDAERQRILRDIKNRHDLNTLSVQALGLHISNLKNQPDEPADTTDKQLLTAYNNALAERSLCDFDDLLVKTHTLLRQSGHASHYQHILIDEFQDTNALQYELVMLLNTSSNICVIGDPLQSIYGFRGANATIFDRFLHDWPQATQVTLTTNYRSVPQVVAVANAVFADAPQLQAHTTMAGEAKAIEVLSDFSEATWIIGQVEQGVGGSDFLKSGQQNQVGTDHQRSFKDFAVLYRTHAAAKILRKCLDEAGIPYQVAGEGSPYQQPGLARIIAGLRYIAGREAAVDNLSPTQTAALLDPLKDQRLPLSKLAYKIGELLDVQSQLPVHDVQQFTNTLVRFDSQPVDDFLTYFETMAEQEFYDPNAEAVTLLTIHAAKGLEFTHAFLLATEEGILPHARKGQVENLEEERRLFYVAATRAREQLHVLHARARGGQPAQPSRFITDLSSDVLPRIIDPNMASQLKKRERARQKRAQTSLF